MVDDDPEYSELEVRSSMFRYFQSEIRPFMI